MPVRAFIVLSLLTCVLSMVAPFDAVAFTPDEVNNLIKCQKFIEMEVKTLSRNTVDALSACVDAKLAAQLQFENLVIDPATFAALDAAANTKCTTQLSQLGPQTTSFVKHVNLACGPVTDAVVAPGSPPTGDPLGYVQAASLIGQTLTTFDRLVADLCVGALLAGGADELFAAPRGFTIVANGGLFNSVTIDPGCSP